VIPVKANIHSFESFGTVDGPGIRFVIFMQGCRFRCLYCHNPDTWSMEGGTLYTLEELVQKVLRYKPYFDHSGGGVTVSGGEPLLQAGFLADFFQTLKENDIHTCLDTSGYFIPEDRDAVCRLLESTDLALLDIKHTDPEAHKKLTGSSWDQVHAFIELTKTYKTPLWLRYVVVPGYTDDPEQVRAFKRLAGELPNAEKTELLPFHKMGEFKWKELGLSYALGDTMPPTQEAMRSLEAL